MAASCWVGLAAALALANVVILVWMHAATDGD
jgi:hypothetical protein